MEIKRFILITQDYFPDYGGITTWCHEVAKQLDKMGFDVVIVAKGKDVPDEKQFIKRVNIENGLKVYRLKRKNWRSKKNYRIYSAIRKFNSTDTAFICLNWKMAVPCMFASFLSPIKYMTVVHGLDAIEDRSLNIILQKLAMIRSDLVIAVSNFTASLLKPLKLPAGKVEVVNNGVDLTGIHYEEQDEEFFSKYGIKSGRRILSLGRLVIRKGFDYTIMAMAKMRHSDVIYYIAGKGDYEVNLKEMAIKHRVTDRVRFIGFVEDKDMNKLYSCADVFSMPSRNRPRDIEGFGITYIEAAACGVPSLAGYGSGAEDAVIHEETGYMVDPESVDDIAEALDRLFDDDEYRINLGKNAQKRVYKQFTWDIKVKEMLDYFYKNLE